MMPARAGQAGEGRARLRAAPPRPSAGRLLPGLPDEFVQCRDWGHAWRSLNARRNDDGSYLVTLRCQRCDCRRTRTISARGAVLATGYDYPDGYLLNGLGRLTGSDRDTLRLDSVRRTLPQGGSGS